MNRFKADTDYAAKREALLARAADLDGRLANLETQRKGLALSAVDGDKDSIRKIDQIDNAADALRRERDTAAAAAEAVEQLERDHQTAAAQHVPVPNIASLTDSTSADDIDK
jgi:hypothetical protein